MAVIEDPTDPLGARRQDALSLVDELSGALRLQASRIEILEQELALARGAAAADGDRVAAAMAAAHDAAAGRAELERALAATEHELRQAREELHALHATRTMRALARPRRAYGRVRRAIREPRAAARWLVRKVRR